VLSVIVEDGKTLINCLTYIDLNPLGAGMMERPEDYRWNSLCYHIQTGNKDDFLSLDFGPVKYASLSLRELHRASPVKYASQSLRELHRARLIEFGLIDAQERLRRYRRYVYEAGALDHPNKAQARVIDNDIVEHERKKNYEISRADRFRYRTRYFTDSGIIGTKEFVSENYQRFKDIFMSKREKIPRVVSGLDGVYSLKRLAEQSKRGMDSIVFLKLDTDPPASPERLAMAGRLTQILRITYYCTPRGMGEKPSPLGEDFSKLAVWNTIRPPGEGRRKEKSSEV
jgi:hypothetical protein